MASKVLRIQIECGEESCASEPGKFCRFLSTERYGTVYHCTIFSKTYDRGVYALGKSSPHTSMKEKDGWLQRHPECIACSEASTAEPKGSK